MFSRDYLLTGKHATYTKYLTNEIKLFSRNIDVYMCGAVVGLKYNLKSARETGDSTSILTDAFNNERANCYFIYQLIMMLGEHEDNKDLSVEERIKRAFSVDIAEIDTKDEKFELFHSYVRGGIEKIYEVYKNDKTVTKEGLYNEIYTSLLRFASAQDDADSILEEYLR